MRGFLSLVNGQPSLLESVPSTKSPRNGFRCKLGSSFGRKATFNRHGTAKKIFDELKGLFYILAGWQEVTLGPEVTHQ